MSLDSSDVRDAGGCVPHAHQGRGERSVLRYARLIARRELRETMRDPNFMLPLLLMPCLIGFLAGLSAFTSFAPSPTAIGTAVTNAALDRLPVAAVQRLSNVPTRIARRLSRRC